MGSSESRHKCRFATKACVVVILLAQSGCDNRTRTISSEVVDESGQPLAGVSVVACYTGWGWSRGSVIWDKSHCSEQVVTGEDGKYIIRFKGPDGMRLRARAQGWIQLKDFLSSDSRIVLTSIARASARHRQEMIARESSFRERRPGDSAQDYYCRVILTRGHAVSINYHGESISVTSALLVPADPQIIMFALRGSETAGDAFAREVQLKFGESVISGGFTVRSDGVSCAADMRIIHRELPGAVTLPDKRITVLLPSVGAAWDMDVSVLPGTAGTKP